MTAQSNVRHFNYAQEGTMKTTVEILRDARALIDTPEKWFAVGENYRPSSLGVYERRCALLAVRHIDHSSEPVRVLARAMGCDGGVCEAIRAVPTFNNSHSHAEVLAAFDTAIANEEAREQEFAVKPIVDEVLAEA